MADRVQAAKQGVYADALSPRDANAQRPPRAADNAKVKAGLASKAAQKDKEHPPPPPAHVSEPPSSDRRDGATYQVGKMLGKGGFAVCYEGSLSRKKYALKIVKSKMPSKMEQKFQTELQIHSKMRHLNIVQFLRAFTFGSSTYLVLELCPNGSLMDMVKRRKGLTEPEVRFYSVQIAGAIKYMHAKGIIHRDLKMGNIFLDQNMNAKIGDFGLAALLVTGKDMQTIRRTTLCGTPNYIAPEILEKGKKGHDHMVDIWSLGIIMFAMLTSKPPFQSATTDEIYRRARDRDYEWPTIDGANYKFISPEAKDLVALMLEEADRRPYPDAIVRHDFFLSGHVPKPSEMAPKLREYQPENDQFYRTDLTPQMLAQNLRNLKDLCKVCEVGPWNHTQKVYTSTWKEVALEEKAGLTPAIPLAENIVYRPYDEVSKELNLAQVSRQPPPQLAPRSEEDKSQSVQAPTGLLRAPPQSFAAQQRSRNRPGNAMERSQTFADLPAPSASSTVRQRAKREVPQSSTEPNVALPTQKAVTITKTMDMPAGTLAIPQGQDSDCATVASKSAQQPLPAMPTCSSASMGPQNPTPTQMESLFSRTEKRNEVPGTKPDVVLERLRRLQSELERALNSRTMAIVGKNTAPPPPQIVVKWVDYSNKFGLGYILNDGGIGCVLKSIPGSGQGKKAVMLHPASILVRKAEAHCQRREDPTYADRKQIVPMDRPIQFYENLGESGISSVSMSPTKFKLSISEDGSTGKVPIGNDIYDFRQREHLILWKKFANYMMAHGRDQEVTTDLSGQSRIPPLCDPALPPNDVVTFYQRIGDVGCWVFADGHLQFNFPDHTKIVLDASGTWCHFWHLPQAAAERLAATGELDEAALDDRAVLSYPLQTLLNFAAKPGTAAAARPSRNPARRRRPDIDPALQGIPAANDLRRKVEFVRDVVREWVANGGLGNCDLSRDRRKRWTGHRDTSSAAAAAGPAKHVWVTIGARWGDQRLSALVDPRNPAVLGPDVDERRRAAA